VGRSPARGIVTSNSTGPKCAGLIKIFFGIITRQAIRRGTYGSVRELTEAITRFIDGWNERSQPFSWTKDADTLIAKAHRKLTFNTRH
jgi:hypothetical protein